MVSTEPPILDVKNRKEHNRVVQDAGIGSRMRTTYEYIRHLSTQA